MITYYIRLLTYEQACQLISYMRDLIDDATEYCHITVGGVSLTTTDGHQIIALEYLTDTDWRWEMTSKHPTQVTDEIVQQLKDDNIIQSN